MAHSFNFSRSQVQFLPAEVAKGWFLTVKTDPKTLTKDSTLDGEWTDIIQLLKTLTDAQKQEIIKILGIQTQFVFTLSTPLDIKNNQNIVIAGEGDIKLWSTAVKGDWFLIVDPLRKLQKQANKVVAPQGHTIGQGQSWRGVSWTVTNEFNLGVIAPIFSGGAIRFIFDGNNWLIDFCEGGGAVLPKPRFLQMYQSLNQMFKSEQMYRVN